jgi:hypothetical protein
MARRRDMARPPKEGLSYFPHDVDASSDEKIEALRALYGNDGYAFYFILLERIYRAPGAELNISDAETLQILAKKLLVSDAEFEKMLQTALSKGLFNARKYESKKVLTSSGIKKRFNITVEKRRKMRERYQQKKGIISDAETRPETPQSKVKKSKEKNIGASSSISSRKRPKKRALRRTDPRITEAIQHFSNIVLEKKNFRPVINGGKDGDAIKRALNGGGMGLDDVKRCFDWYLGTEKAKEHLTISAALSADSVNLFRQTMTSPVSQGVDMLTVMRGGDG